jgi:hypothetical protein
LGQLRGAILPWYGDTSNAAGQKVNASSMKTMSDIDMMPRCASKIEFQMSANGCHHQKGYQDLLVGRLGNTTQPDPNCDK